MNRVTAVTNAIGARESYTYNAQGLLAESRNAADEKTTYEYDAAGRIIKQKDSLGTISYTYDKNGNVLTVTDKNGTISRSYDALNRVTAVTDYKGDTIRYGYDQLGNRVSITYPGGEKVRYAYYKDGNLKSVTDKDGNVTYYTYDENGRLTETERRDRSRERRTYDTAEHLLGIRDESVAGEIINEYVYEYDVENIRTASVTNGIRPEYTTDRESIYSQTLVKNEYEKNVFGSYTEPVSSTTYTYGLEGNYAMATVSAICALPFVGSLVGGSAGMALKIIGHSLTFGMAAQGTWEATGRAVEAYQNGTLT